MASSLALKKLVSSTLVPNSLRSIRPIASITPLASSRLFNTNALRDYDGLKKKSSSPELHLRSTSSPSLLTDAHSDPSTAIERPVIRNMNWCNDSFWRDIEILINSDIGTFIIEESRTRNNMAFYLQLYGPSVLRDVTKSDILLMVEIMISEKKLVQEPAHNNKPFKSEEEEKTYEHVREMEKEMEKEIIRLKKRIKKREKEKKQERDELNAEIENFQKLHEELKSQIRKTKQALKVAEEEIMKAKFDATSN